MEAFKRFHHYGMKLMHKQKASNEIKSNFPHESFHYTSRVFSMLASSYLCQYESNQQMKTVSTVFVHRKCKNTNFHRKQCVTLIFTMSSIKCAHSLAQTLAQFSFHFHHGAHIRFVLNEIFHLLKIDFFLCLCFVSFIKYVEHV